MIRRRMILLAARIGARSRRVRFRDHARTARTVTASVALLGIRRVALCADDRNTARACVVLTLRDLMTVCLIERVGQPGLGAQRDRRRLAADDLARDRVCLPLHLMTSPRAASTTTALLHHMCELVRDEPVALPRARLVGAGTKMHLAVLRHGLRRAGRHRARGVHLHARQIDVEESAHLRAYRRIQRCGLPRPHRRLQRRHRARHITCARQLLVPPHLVRRRGLPAPLHPLSGLRCDQRLPARRADCQLAHTQRTWCFAAELDADSRHPAHVGAEPAAARGDARPDRVESAPRLLRVVAAVGVGRFPAHPFPDRQRQLARQAVGGTLDERIELISDALALKLGWTYPPRQGRRTPGLVTLTIGRSNIPSGITREYSHLATTLHNEAPAGVHPPLHEWTLSATHPVQNMRDPRSTARYTASARRRSRHARGYGPRRGETSGPPCGRAMPTRAAARHAPSRPSNVLPSGRALD